MGKHDKKTAKGRLDKYYHLAKEQGYRARSAFKLIQLNKKYNFLEKSKVLIDLCAAPGGWLQVAQKYMPQQSLVIGVDLVAIKPIPGVITFVNDITTDKCRANLRNEMKTWKADVVLHDGAPNVGTAWVQDAYTQSELALVSLKLATEFLIKGGTFVTKVFRSKDYNNLMWVFNQLFKKVEATKPASSRNVSAEIYVVCREFIAPKKIDQRFLDPKTVFSDLPTETQSKQVDVFHPDKKRRQRDGYEEGNYTLHKTVDVMEFINAQDPIQVLGSVNKFSWESDEAKELMGLKVTDDDIKVSSNDLKVLGKGDFKHLLKWRIAIRETKKMDKKEEEEKPQEENEVDEDDQIEEELANLNREQAAQQKRRKRKSNEKRQKEVIRMQLNMTIPTDIGLEQEGPNANTLFRLSKIDHARMLKAVRRADMDAVDYNEDSSDDNEDMEFNLEAQRKAAKLANAGDKDDDAANSDSDTGNLEELEAELNAKYEDYKERQAERDAKYRVKQLRDKEERFEGFGKKRNGDGESDSDQDSNDDDSDEAVNDRGMEDLETSDSDSDESEEGAVEEKPKKKVRFSKKNGNPLLVGLDDKEIAEMKKKTSNGLTKKAAMFFSQPLFKEIKGLEGDDGDEDDEDEDEEEMDEQHNDDPMELDGDNTMKINQPMVKNNRKRKAVEELEEEESFEIVPKQEEDEMWDGEEDENSKAVKRAQDVGLITAEAMTLAQALVNGKKTKANLVDDGFTKHAFNNKDGLPEWFLDDETKFNKPNLPVTKEAMQAIREKMRALDARPIKKIAEAKARKKFKAAKHLEKLRKKASDLAENPDMSEKEKSTAVAKMLAKGTKKKPKREVKLVVAKGSAKGIKGRPKGVKGRYKMVDARMKKDLRAMKRIKKRDGKKRK